MSETDITAYGQSWYAATMVDTPRRPALHVDLDVDVCVIGGGLAGRCDRDPDLHVRRIVALWSGAAGDQLPDRDDACPWCLSGDGDLFG